MANPAELPELVEEFVEMSKEYLRQETVEPAKKLGRYAGYAVGAAAAFALGALFLAIAGARLIIRVLPDGPYWEGLGYVLAALVLAAVAGIMIQVTNNTTDVGGSDGSAPQVDFSAGATTPASSGAANGTASVDPGSALADTEAPPDSDSKEST
jgi:hypothetical protein